GDEEDRCAQELLVPEPRDALLDVGRQPRCPRLTLLLERGPDEEQRDERDRIGDRVERERERAAEAKEQAAERLAPQFRALLARLVLSDRRRQLLARDDAGQSRRLGEAEEDEERSFDERDDDDLRQGRGPGRERDGDAPERERASRLGDEHDPLPVPAVDQRARREVEQHERERLREADEPRL